MLSGCLVLLFPMSQFMIFDGVWRVLFPRMFPRFSVEKRSRTTMAERLLTLLAAPRQMARKRVQQAYNETKWK